MVTLNKKLLAITFLSAMMISSANANTTRMRSHHKEKHPKKIKVISNSALLTLRHSIQQHNYTAAFTQAEKIKLQYEGDPTFDFLYGIAAAHSNHAPQALFAFDRVLSVHPNDPRVKLEYGLVQYQLKNNAIAKQALRSVLKSNPPPSVQQNIRNVLNLMDRPGAVSNASRNPDASHVFAKVRFAGGYDTNVNTSPNDRVINIPFFGNVALGNNAIANDSVYGEIQPEIFAIKPLNKTTTVFGSINGRYRQNPAAERFDTQGVGAVAGLGFNWDKFSLSLPLSAQSTWLHQRRFSRTYAASAQGFYVIDAKTKAGAYLSFNRVSYPNTFNYQNAYYQNTRGVIGGVLLDHAFTTHFGSPISASIKFFVGKDTPIDGRFPHIGRNFIGNEDTIRWSPSPAYSPYVNLRLQRSHYGSAVPGFLVTRQDRELGLSGGVQIPVNPSWMFEPSYLYQRNNTNTVIYQYKKHLFSLALTYNTELF